MRTNASVELDDGARPKSLCVRLSQRRCNEKVPSNDAGINLRRHSPRLLPLRALSAHSTGQKFPKRKGRR